MYRTSKAYALPPWESPGTALWSWVADQLSLHDHVLDLGCGVAPVYRMLARRGEPMGYVGVDFSAEAIRRSREAGPSATWIQAELPAWLASDEAREVLARTTIVVACEFLEHFALDLETLAALPELRILATVPKFDDPGHVRFFPDVTDAAFRYRCMFGTWLPVGPNHFGVNGRITR